MIYQTLIEFLEGMEFRLSVSWVDGNGSSSHLLSALTRGAYEAGDLQEVVGNAVLVSI